MYQTVDLNDTLKAFQQHGRLDDGNGQFSVNGVAALFDYLRQVEEDTGHEMELDVIALCCQFSEYNSACLAVGDIDPDACREIMRNNNDEAAEDEEALEWLMDRTTVIEFDGGIIIDSEF